MEEAPDFELRTERWCAGLRFVDTRPLEPVERALLQGCLQALARRFWTAVACVPVGVAVPLSAAMLLPRPSEPVWLGGLLAVCVIGLACGVPTLFALRARDAWRERRLYCEDLGAGELLRFEGALGETDTLDDEQLLLLDLGLLVPIPETAQRLEVLPASNAVICRRPRRPLRLVKVRVVEVAMGPTYAMRIEVPRELAYIREAPDVRFLRRSLNAHERAELVAHIQRLRRPNLAMALWFTWFTAWALALALHPDGVLRFIAKHTPLVAAQIGVLAVMTLAYVRALRLAAGLERDTNTGWAFTLQRTKDEPDGEPDAGGEETLAEDTPPEDPRHSIEFLPHSRAVWNERGRPARWRNLRRAA